MQSTTATARRCAGCGTAHYLPSLGDPRWCYRCAIFLPPPHITCFGVFRRVPPRLAAHW